MLIKALLQARMENAARGGMLRDKYTTRGSQVLYLSQDTSLNAVFFIHMSTGSTITGILYFELLLSQYHS